MAIQLCRPYIYVMLLGVIALNVVLHMTTRAHVVWSHFWFDYAWIAATVPVLILIARRFPDPAARPLPARIIGYLSEAILLVMIMTLSLRIMDQVSKVFAPAYADPWLIEADALLGLDWLAYFTWIHDRPDLHFPLITAYWTIELATIAAAIGLLLFKRLDRVRLLLESFVICAIISIIFGAIFPAEAAVATQVPDLAAYPNFDHPPGVYHLTVLDALRDPTVNFAIGPNGMPGLVTVPSLHTAIGILIILACLRTPLFWPAMVYGALMIAGTPVWGGHYIVDLFAGAALAMGVVYALGRHRSNAGLWTATPLVPSPAAPQPDTAPA